MLSFALARLLSDREAAAPSLFFRVCSPRSRSLSTSSLSPSSRSYQASRDDLAVFAALSSAPDAKTYPAAARWFSHIKALLGASFPGAGKGVSVAGGAGAAGAGAAAAAAPAAAKAAAAAASSDSDSDDSDDELDLFGEMTPEEQAAAEAKKKVIEEAKRRGAEKAKLTKSMIVLDVKPWDDETDLAAMEAEVSCVLVDGVVLYFGARTRERENEGEKERRKLTKKKLEKKIFSPGPRHPQGRPPVGSLQARPDRLRHQEDADHGRHRGRQGRVDGRDHRRFVKEFFFSFFLFSRASRSLEEREKKLTYFSLARSSL